MNGQTNFLAQVLMSPDARFVSELYSDELRGLFHGKTAQAHRIDQLKDRCVGSNPSARDRIATIVNMGLRRRSRTLWCKSFHNVSTKDPQPAERATSFVTSKLNTQPAYAPVYASPLASRPATQNSGPGWIACSFPVRLFHSLLHAGLILRTHDLLVT
jgi:hypothetical protein